MKESIKRYVELRKKHFEKAGMNENTACTVSTCSGCNDSSSCGSGE